MKLREKLRGAAVAALVGAGSALVRLGARLDGITVPEELEPEPPLQDPLTRESFELLDHHRPTRPKMKANHQPLRGSAQERYAKALERRRI